MITASGFFNVSKDYELIVQEYGKNVGLKTACFRAGCITGLTNAQNYMIFYLT